MRFRLAVDEPNWLLLTGGHCSEVVVNTGLTVYRKVESIVLYTKDLTSVKVLEFILPFKAVILKFFIWLC